MSAIPMENLGEETKSIATNVSNCQDVNRLGPFIAYKLMREGYDEVILNAIGAGAVNQAVKSIVNARGLTKKDHQDIFVTIAMEERQLNGQTKSSVIFSVKKT